ncbi:iron chaperone [Rufibacter hautae]|uniref:YdhG-like domain-containing protein n=1 Tax=Rufibacter hautae TaxID=2595005 RepID=A0A5B6TU30_9BACT|nr:DUF1801 domain-containing protein [Rufibacter hautae]KAA3440058.1 hypothetical protein FOA19_05155 [Rufibacter hautae]
MTTATPTTIDHYIAGFPEDTQKVLEQIRARVKELVPEAEETISYAIPTFKLTNKPLVYFAAYKNHIGVYPAPVEDLGFKEAVAGYKTGKGTVQLPLNKPLPLDLITRIVEFRKNEIAEKKAGQQKSK